MAQSRTNELTSAMPRRRAPSAKRFHSPSFMRIERAFALAAQSSSGGGSGSEGRGAILTGGLLVIGGTPMATGIAVVVAFIAGCVLGCVSESVARWFRRARERDV